VSGSIFHVAGPVVRVGERWPQEVFRWVNDVADGVASERMAGNGRVRRRWAGG